MCECGCISNDRRYSFPKGGDSFYVLTLSVPCRNCDSPPGVSIELITQDHTLYMDYLRGDFLDGELPFEQWPDGPGVGIVTGMRHDEFQKAMQPHLIGVDSDELGEDGVLDEAGAEVIVDEMYADSQMRPRLAGEAG